MLPSMWQLLIVQMQPTFPVGQHNHHTTLRIESNQSRRRPTSWSFCQNSPTPVSMRSPCREVELFLLLHLKPRFRFPRNLERRWSLSSLQLSFLNPPLFRFLLFPHPTVGPRWVKGLSSLLPHVHFSMALKISPYPLIHLPWISF